MTTSVPSVRPISDLLWQLGRWIELARDFYKLTGDPTEMTECVKYARRVYEEDLKPRANLGKFDRERLDMIRESIEALEKIAAKWATKR